MALIIVAARKVVPFLPHHFVRLRSPDLFIIFIVRADAGAAGKTIGELELRSRTGATVIAVVRDGRTDINPGPEHRVRPEDVIVLPGTPEQIDLAIEHINGP